MAPILAPLCPLAWALVGRRINKGEAMVEKRARPTTMDGAWRPCEPACGLAKRR
jgi:hypothetical protein